MKKVKVYPFCVLCDSTITIDEEYLKEFNSSNDTDYPLEQVENIIKESDINDFFDNIRYSKYNDNKVTIFGTLGLWNGKREIIPVVCENVESAIRKCINKCDDFKVIQNNGIIEVEAYHHDGTNVFQIKFMNEKGINMKNGNLENKIYYKKIKGYIF